MKVIKITNTDLVLKFIQNNKVSYCDDCLSKILNMYPRQQVNQICNKLKVSGAIHREISQCFNCSKNKILNVVR